MPGVAAAGWLRMFPYGPSLAASWEEIEIQTRPAFNKWRQSSFASRTG